MSFQRNMDIFLILNTVNIRAIRPNPAILTTNTASTGFLLADTSYFFLWRASPKQNKYLPGGFNFYLNFIDLENFLSYLN